jgi:hypothetical protein
MRKLFPGFFRPTPDEFQELWKDCLFAVDANVLLNLYRYSPATRQELEKALTSVKERLFLPHQAAKEFLKNRLNVTAAQADEYAKTIKTIKDLSDTLTNRKRHPFLPEEQHQTFVERFAELCQHLEAQRDSLLSRLTNDEILRFVETTFADRTGSPLGADVMKGLPSEGDYRYQHDIPPGYRDGKKDSSGDPYRKYGDLIAWKQIIAKAKSDGKSVVFITDDKKDDWWLDQSGRTISPRPELIDEFLQQTGKSFWMYSVEKFVEEASRLSNAPVAAEVIAEIVEVRETSQPEPVRDEVVPSARRRLHPVLSEEELLDELTEFLASHPSEDGSVGLRYFVVNYLGRQDYEINHSYARVNALAEAGKVELFKAEKNGLTTTRIRPRAQTIRPADG